MASKLAEELAKEIATSIALDYERIADFVDRYIQSEKGRAQVKTAIVEGQEITFLQLDPFIPG